MIHIRRFTSGGEELRPGLRLRHHSNLESLTFSFHTVLDAVEPDIWHGEVRFAGQLLLDTPSFPNEAQAGRAAEEALETQGISLFRTDRDRDARA
jgi:hypothetical protein